MGSSHSYRYVETSGMYTLQKSDLKNIGLASTIKIAKYSEGTVSTNGVSGTTNISVSDIPVAAFVKATWTNTYSFYFPLGDVSDGLYCIPYWTDYTGNNNPLLQIRFVPNGTTYDIVVVNNGSSACTVKALYVTYR